MSESDDDGGFMRRPRERHAGDHGGSSAAAPPRPTIGSTTLTSGLPPIPRGESSAPAESRKKGDEKQPNNGDDAEATAAESPFDGAVWEDIDLAAEPALGAEGMKAQHEQAAPLPDAIRGELETATGTSLGHVHVHAGKRGNAIAAAHGARAVTIGSEIYIADGELDLSSAEGRALIAHEVAHVLQAEAHPGPEQAAAKRGDDARTDRAGAERGAEDSVQAAEDEADGFASQFRERGGAMSWRPAVGVSGGTPMRATISIGEVMRRLPAQPAADVAWAYLRAHQTQFVDTMAKRLASVAVPAHERLAWQPGGIAAVFAEALLGSLDGNQLFARLPELLHPTNPWTVIDQNRALVEGQPGVIVDGREPKGPLTWNPLAGDALAIEVATRMRESLARMAPRYAAQLDETRTTPVTVADLVASHPMDRVTARLLCDSRVVKPVAGGAKSSAKGPTDPALFRDGVRILAEWHWLGDRDPRLWNWIEVKEPRDARAEEVAATLFQERGEPAPHLAYIVTAAAPCFRIDPPWARKVLGAAAPPVSGPDKPHEDNALGLAESEIATDVAIAQASDERKLDRRGVGLPPNFERLGDLLEQSQRRLERAKNLLVPWKLWEQTLPAINWVAKYRENLMGISKERLSALTPVIEGQQALLFDAVGDVQEITSVGANVAPVDGDTGPITNVLRNYAVAIGESHLLDSARAQLTTAREAKAGMTLALLDRSMTESHDAVRELAGSERKDFHYGGADAAAKHTGYQRQLVELRAKRAAGEAVDQNAVSLLAANLKEHTLDTKVKSLYVQLHQLMEEARTSTFGGMETIASAFDSDVRGLPTKVMALITALQDGVINPWEQDKKARQSSDQRILAWTTDNNTRAAQRRFDEFIAESKLGELIPRAVAAIERQSERTAIVTTIVQIAAMIGVSVIAGMAGSAVSGAVRGAMIADAAVASEAMIMTTRVVSTVAGIATDATVSTAGQTALQGGSGKEAWLNNFFSSVAVLAALRPLHRAAASWPTAGAKLHKAAVLTAEMITAAAVSYATERALTSGVPDEATAASWIARGASMAVGKFISVRLTGLEQRLATLAEYGARKLNTTKARKLAKRVEEIGDEESAVELLEEHHRLLTEEAEQLASVSKQVPPDVLRDLTAENHAERTGPRDAAVAMLPLTAAGLAPDDASGKVWAGAREDIVVALDEARRAGVSVEVVEHDFAARRWRVRYNNNEITLLEVKTRSSARAPDAAESSAESDHGAPKHLGEQIASAVGARYVDGGFEIAGATGPISVAIRRANGAAAVHRAGAQVVLDIPKGLSAPEFERAVIGKLTEVRNAERQRTASDVVDTSSDTVHPPATPAKILVLAGDDARLTNVAKLVRPEPGMLDVLVHGEIDGLLVVRGEEEISIDHRALAIYIKKSGLKFTAIRLLACDGGKHPKGVAQHLANKLGVDVWAPTDKLFINEDTGELIIGPRADRNTGKFEPYKPKKTGFRYSKPADTAPKEPRARDRSPGEQGTHRLGPDDRPDRESHRQEDTSEQVATGFEAARQGVDAKGELPKDVIDVITRDLPEAQIDPEDPVAGISSYLKSQLPEIPNLKVVPAGGGKSGAAVYFVKDGDRVIGVFKIFRDASEMAREIAALRRLRELNLQNMEPVGIGKAATVEQLDSRTGAAMMTPAKGDFIKKSLDDAGAATGPARTEAIAKLSRDNSAVAKALAEFHVKSASGKKVTTQYKDQEISKLRDRWEAIKNTRKIPDRDVVAIAPKLEALYTVFHAADLDASYAHGDAHVGNFSLGKDGKVSVIDTETLFRSVGSEGKGVAPGATDVGRFKESLRTFGTEANLTAAEISKLQTEFVSRYNEHYTALAGKSPSSGEDAATRLYQANLETIALNSLLKTLPPRTGPRAVEDAAMSKVAETIDALKATLGLPSRFSAGPADTSSVTNSEATPK